VPQNNTGDILRAIYNALETYYGPQNWWPGHTDSPWEIMLGSVLTQHTTWTNVELAFQNILSVWGPDGLRRPELYLDSPVELIAALLRSAGFPTAKPRKVQSLARFVIDYGGLDALVSSVESTESLRGKLLAVWGIGPETADAILLYALGRPIFVADAYALRIASRWGLLKPTDPYDRIQSLFMDNLPHDAALFNEYHALLVAHGKDLCRPRPRCESCPLFSDLPLPDGSTWRCARNYVPDLHHK
jgi:endonuclease III related protein